MVKGFERMAGLIFGFLDVVQCCDSVLWFQVNAGIVFRHIQNHIQNLIP